MVGPVSDPCFRSQKTMWCFAPSPRSMLRRQPATPLSSWNHTEEYQTSIITVLYEYDRTIVVLSIVIAFLHCTNVMKTVGLGSRTKSKTGWQVGLLEYGQVVLVRDFSDGWARLHEDEAVGAKRLSPGLR